MLLVEAILVSIPLVALLCLYFWRVVFLGHVPLPTDMIFDFPFFKGAAPTGFQHASNALLSDMVLKFYPWHTVVRESLRIGQLPTWNPYLFAGTPLFANAESAILYPINLVSYLLPQKSAYTLSVFLRLWIAGLGMFLFARSLNIRHFGAFIAAITFMFSGSMIVWLNYPVGNSYAWTPMLFFITERLIITRRPITAAFIGLVIAVQILGGHYQTVFIVLVAWLLYYAYRILGIWRQSHNLRSVLSSSLLLGVSVGAGFMLAAVQLFPFAEWLSLTNEVQYRLANNTVRLIHPAFAPSLVIALVTLGLPNFFGNPTWGSPMSFFYSNFIEETLYVGIAPLVCVAIALWGTWKDRHDAAPFSEAMPGLTPQRQLILPLAVLAGLFLGLALHMPGVDLVHYLPVFNVVAVPRYRLIFTFCLAILAGVGAERLFQLPREIPLFRHISRILLIFSGLGLSLLMFVHWLFVNFQGTLISYGRIRTLYPIMVWAFNPFNPSMSFPAFIALGVAGLLLLHRRWRSPVPLMRGLLLTLIVVDLFLFGVSFNPTLPPEQIFPETKTTRFLRDRLAVYGLARIVAMNDDLPANTGAPYGFAEIAGSDFPTRRYVELTRAMGAELVGTNRIRFSTIQPRLLDLLNVRYVVASRYPNGVPIGKLKEIYVDPYVKIYENPDALPRAYIVYRAVVAMDDQQTLDLLKSPGFNPREAVILTEPLLEPLPEQAPKTASRVQIEQYQPQQVDITVETELDGLLVLSDADYPGWQAFIDGHATKIYQANYALRAVYVPRGTHRIQFTYTQVGLQAGLIASGLGVVLIIGISVLNLRGTPVRDDRHRSPLSVLGSGRR